MNRSKTIAIAIRIVAVLVLLLPLLFFTEFYNHFYAYLTGNVNAIQKQWHIVLLSIILFVAFLVPLSYRRTTKWSGYALPIAFFVSLFIEMYGIPFTFLFLSKYLTGETSSVDLPRNSIEFNWLGVSFGMDTVMLYGTLLIFIGSILIMLGWITLYKHIKKTPLVTSGIYSYSRHPQYLGFILIIVGWFFGWPTLITMVFAPILIYKYLRVCFTEEKELADDTDYQEYKKQVPFFL